MIISVGRLPLTEVVSQEQTSEEEEEKVKNNEQFSRRL